MNDPSMVAIWPDSISARTSSGAAPAARAISRALKTSRRGDTKAGMVVSDAAWGKTLAAAAVVVVPVFGCKSLRLLAAGPRVVLGKGQGAAEKRTGTVLQRAAMSSIQHVIVTGASSGIGKAAALRFAGAGASVLATGRDDAVLLEVAAAVERQ